MDELPRYLYGGACTAVCPSTRHVCQSNHFPAAPERCPRLSPDSLRGSYIVVVPSAILHLTRLESAVLPRAPKSKQGKLWRKGQVKQATSTWDARSRSICHSKQSAIIPHASCQCPYAPGVFSWAVVAGIFRLAHAGIVKAVLSPYTGYRTETRLYYQVSTE